MLSVGLLLWGLLGCGGTCDNVCRKIVDDCGELNTTGMTQLECEESCGQQEDLYDSWTDTQLQDAFAAELDCLHEASCDDIAAGQCYDASVWTYERLDGEESAAE